MLALVIPPPRAGALDACLIHRGHIVVLHKVAEGHPVFLLVVANVQEYIVQAVELVWSVLSSGTATTGLRVIVALHRTLGNGTKGLEKIRVPAEFVLVVFSSNLRNR
jgi:hypothetical protein